MFFIVVVGLIVVFIFVSLVGMYNSLISKKNQVENAFASIDVMLKKRYDLIPNLVESCKVHMKHEKTTLENIVALRNKVVSEKLSSEEKLALNNKISHGLGQIMVAVENYPNLKSNQNIDQLMRSLNEVEEQLSASRRAFNAAITDLNNAIEMFPTSIIAAMMAMRQRELLKTIEEEKKNVDVKKLFSE